MKRIGSSTLVMFATLSLSVASIGHADDLEFKAVLSGGQEVVFDSGGNFVPGGRDTPAKGFVHVKFNAAFTKVRVFVKIENLLGTFAGAHFHCERAGANGPLGLGLNTPGPLSFDGRRIQGTLTNHDFFADSCTDVIGRPVNNLAALALAMRDGLIYLNIHSTVYPAGEIRGQMLEDDHKHNHKKKH